MTATTPTEHSYAYGMLTAGAAPQQCRGCGKAAFGVCGPCNLVLCTPCFDQHKTVQPGDDPAQRTQVMAGFFSTLLSLWQRLMPVPQGEVFVPDAIVAAATVVLFAEHPRFLARAALADSKVLPLLYSSVTGHNLRSIVATLVLQANEQGLFPEDTPPVPGYFDLLDAVQTYAEPSSYGQWGVEAIHAGVVEFARTVLMGMGEETKLAIEVVSDESDASVPGAEEAGRGGEGDRSDSDRADSAGS